MLSRISNFSGPLSILFKRNLDQNNLILDLQSTFGLSGSTWIDQSSYNNNATFYGSIVTDSINGEIVLSLDGVNDYIFPANGFGNILDTGFTYEVWARTGTSSNGSLLLETGQPGETPWNDVQIGFVSNKINVGLYDPADFTPGYITGPTFSINTWYNIVMTYDGTTLTEYINGVSVGSNTGIRLNPTSTYLSLGRPGLATNYLGGSTGYFKGYIGTWRIWDGPLDNTEILLNYNTNKEAYDTFITNNTILYLDAGSASSYPGSGSVWYDLSVQDNDATLTNITYSSVNGGYFTFNGTINSKGSLTSAKYNVAYSGKTVFVSAYLSSDMTNDTYRAFEGSSAGARNFNFYLHRDSSGNYKLHYSVGLNSFQGGFSNNLASFTPGTWFTVAVTQTTGNLVTYYFNGQPFGTNNAITFSQYLSSTPPSEIDAIGVADNFWDGRIGLASVYKVALSSSEILQNHNSVKNRYSNFVDTNLILYFNPNKDLNYPTSISDLSGNSLNGTLSNNTFTAPYLSFNGSSSEVTITDNSLLEPGSGSFTMEVWVNQSVLGNDVVLGKFNNGGASQHVSYSIRTTNTTFYAQIGSGSGSGGGPTGTLFVNSTSHVGTLNTWYQIVYVFKNGATKNLETFVNGSSIGVVNHNLSSVLNSTNPLYVGSYNGGEYSQYFDGKIGIVRIYNSALSDSDVSKNFEANRDIYEI